MTSRCFFYIVCKSFKASERYTGSARLTRRTITLDDLLVCDNSQDGGLRILYLRCHELEQLVHHCLEELPVSTREARILTHDIT